LSEIQGLFKAGFDFKAGAGTLFLVLAQRNTVHKNESQKFFLL